MGGAISILLLGISFGLVYFLLAAGMTLTMGLLRVVNMSHGAIFLFSGYCGVWFYTVTGGWIWGVLFGTLVGAALGFLLETVFLRRLYSNPAGQVLLTIGFIYILQNIVLWIWGGFPVAVPSPTFLTGHLTIGDTNIPYTRFFIIIVGIVIAGAVWFIQEKTKVGAMVRAGMDNGEISSAMGIDRRKIFLFIFVLGSAIAGLAAMVGGPLTNLESSTGWSILLNAIIVVVVGGAGSIQGALIGGLALGIINAFGSAYFPMLSSYIVYIVLIVMLVVRPQGILGRKQDINKADDNYSSMSAMKKRSFDLHMLGEGRYAPTLRAKVCIYNAIPYAFVAIISVILPLVCSTFQTTMLTKVMIYALFAMSLDVVMGYTGNRSFGHAAYFGVGAYCVALIPKYLGITNFWLILLITIVVGAVLAGVIGYFTLKLSGTNFLLVTMAFCQLLNVIASKWTKVTGGTDGIVGIKYPELGGFLDEMIGKWNGTKIYYFTLMIFAICFVILYLVMHSSFGTTLLGIRGNEGRMRAVGFNTWSMGFAGIIIAGIFAAIAGLLFAYAYRAVTPTVLALETSALPMLMVIMGGGATLWGPALGAVVIILVQTYSGIVVSERWPLILGILYVVCVMFLQGGFAPRLQRFWDWIGTRFFKKELKDNKEASAEEV